MRGIPLMGHGQRGSLSHQVIESCDDSPASPGWFRNTNATKERDMHRPRIKLEHKEQTINQTVHAGPAGQCLYNSSHSRQPNRIDAIANCLRQHETCTKQFVRA